MSHTVSGAEWALPVTITKPLEMIPSILKILPGIWSFISPFTRQKISTIANTILLWRPRNRVVFTRIAYSDRSWDPNSNLDRKADYRLGKSSRPVENITPFSKKWRWCSNFFAHIKIPFSSWIFDLPGSKFRFNFVLDFCIIPFDDQGFNLQNTKYLQNTYKIWFFSQIHW